MLIRVFSKIAQYYVSANLEKYRALTHSFIYFPCRFEYSLCSRCLHAVEAQRWAHDREGDGKVMRKDGGPCITGCRCVHRERVCGKIQTWN